MPWLAHACVPNALSVSAAQSIRQKMSLAILRNCLAGIFLNMKFSKNVWSPMKSYEAGKLKGRVPELWRASRNCIQVEVWVELDNTDTQDGKHLCFPQLLPLHPLVLNAGFISFPSECPISHKQFFSKIGTAPLRLLFYSLLRTRFRSLAQRGFLRLPWDQSCWEAPYKCKSLPLWRKELETPFSKGSGCTLHFILSAWQIPHSPYPGSAMVWSHELPHNTLSL